MLINALFTRLSELHFEREIQRTQYCINYGFLDFRLGLRDQHSLDDR